jgi:serine/threonine protein kinase
MRLSMKCPVCGQENKTDALFCAFCGTVIESESSTLRSGQLVDEGTYRVIRPLGKGGMGAVYLAANTKAFGRQCVIKEVIEYYDPNDPQEHQKAIQRFELEARTLAALKHPGIPDIYAYFSQSGRNYLVMEYIEGPNLAQGLTREVDGKVTRGHPLQVENVVRYAIQICEVLTYLEHHQPPVMHNDIKPANIILDKNSGQAVLVDFGTAKTRYTRQGAGQPGQQQSSVYGTVGFAAPELYDGKAEPRSDVHALAATAYHLLTDDDPRAHPFKFPKMDTVPQPLRQMLLDALNIDVKKRLSAAELGEQLKSSLDPKAMPAPQLRMITGRLQYERATGLDRSQAIVIANTGGSYLYGTVSSPAKWIKVDGRIKCAPGQTQSLPVTVDTRELTPGKTYQAQVNIEATSAQSASIAVEVRVPPPRVDIVPMQVDLGTVPRKGLFTERGSFEVRNSGKSRADCQIQGNPPWLVLDPVRFTCSPDETRVVELVGRVDLLPKEAKQHRATLQIDIEGRHPRQVQVTVGKPSGKAQDSRLGSFVMIGGAALILLAAIVWFVLTVLPMLIP